ncbi:MAG: Bcr/CflA family multidrug efflux MFS transporter [Alphaproteobacteria bacterium]|nr:Bcr/CflA family multidrug efflux MFS transporter [Alphaproteobacteria bacterium]
MTITNQAKNRGLVLTLGALSAFGPMSIDMYLPSLPTITREFATDEASVQLTLSALLVGFALAQLFYGPISDRFGRRLPLIVGIALYVIASLGCALATNVETMIAMRFIQGFGGAVGPVLARAVVRDLFEKNEAARMLSILFLIMAAAPLLAPALGGQVLTFMGWRGVFWILMGFGVICIAMVIFLLPETLSGERRTRHNAAAMVKSYGELLIHRRYLGYAFSSGFILAGMFVYISWSPFVFIDTFGIPPQYFFLIFSTNVAGMMVCASLNSRFVTRFGVDRMLVLSTAWAAFAASVMAVFALVGLGGLLAIVIPLFCYLMTIAVTASNGTAGALADFPHMAGTASALMGTMHYALGAILGALVGTVFDGRALPMAGAIAFAGLVGLASQIFLVGSPKRVEGR